MPDTDAAIDLLRTLRDTGVRPPDPGAVRTRVVAAVAEEIAAEEGTEAGRRAGGVGGRRRTRRLRRPSAGALVTTAGALVTIAVAVAAIALLSHHRAGQRAAAGPRGLIAKLAVLRRPQTTADVLPAHLHLARYDGAIVAGLTRLAATEPRLKLFVVVTAPAPNGGRGLPFWNPALGDHVAIVVVTPHGSRESFGVPAAALTDGTELTAAGQTTMQGAQRPAGPAYWVGIVPDGVTRVRWRFGGVQGLPARILEPRVFNNIAIAPLLGTGGGVQHATWYAADGRVIPTSDRALRRATAARDAVLRARAVRDDSAHSYRPNPQILSNFTVFSITSPTGVRTAGGNVISRPPLSALPLPILEIDAPNEPPQLDPLDIRQVTTPSGLRLWVIPGRHGICVAEVDPPLGPGGVGGAGQGCSGNLALALAHGAGLSSGGPGGVTVNYGVVPRTQATVRLHTGLHTYVTIRVPDGVYAVRTRPGQR